MNKLTYSRRFGAFLAFLLLLVSLLPVSLAEENEILLQQGDRGDDVIAMKQRLYELGYFSTDNFGASFNQNTAQGLRSFQEQNGLEPTGVLSAKDKELLFSDGAMPYVAPTPTPQPTVAPQVIPPQRSFAPADAPARDEEGFLLSGKEYFFENDADGQWAYLSPTLQIIINRYTDESVPLIWFETEIWLREGERLLTTENNPDRPGTRFSYPFDIATANQYVLGFTDDFYGHRIYRKETPGIVIREGEVITNKTYKKRLHSLPNLDMLAQYPDGSLKTWYCGSITADELLADGAINVFCFGPVVIQDGKMDELVEQKFYETKSPRQLLGMIEPNHYLLLTVQGRMDDSIGAGLIKPTQILLARGVTEGFNLDGGNTMALVFRGRMLNNLAKWKDKKFVRTVTSLIGVGISSQAIPPEELSPAQKEE